MIQIKTFSDSRHDYYCCYCGGIPSTRDHVPSRILLDEPYPENLPVVACCLECNQGFSLDEEYIACIIECAISGSVDETYLQRDKIKQILLRKAALKAKIVESCRERNGHIFFNVDVLRLENLATKLAKGHLKYENSEPIFDKPFSITYKALPEISQAELDLFVKPVELGLLPEIGSRSSQSMLIEYYDKAMSKWSVVQEGNYAYSVIVTSGKLSVRMIVRNYFIVEVIWLT